MKIAFWLDPVENIKPNKDTSIFLMQAAQDLGNEVFFFYQEDLFSTNKEVFSTLHKVQINLQNEDFLKITESRTLNLKSMDCIFIRKEPPFDRSYLYSTQLLQLLEPDVKIVNSPRGLQTWNEKLSILEYPELIPKTFIGQNLKAITDFLSKSSAQRFSIKPIDGFGGKGISFINKQEEEKSKTAIKTLSHSYQQKIVIQEFVDRASEGDKRVLLLNGEVLGAILRKAPEGQLLHNLDQGGKAYSSNLTKTEQAICEQLSFRLKELNILFAGIDFLGERLTEINITSPTGLQELSRFTSTPFHHQIISTILK